MQAARPSCSSVAGIIPAAISGSVGPLTFMWRGGGESENCCGEQQRICEVVDALHLYHHAGVEQLHDHDWPIDKHDQQDNPSAEIRRGHARFFIQQNGCAGE